MFKNPFKNTLYVIVHPNRFELKHIESGNTLSVTATTAFTTRRLLVGQFMAAETTLKTALNKIYSGTFFTPKPALVIHPATMCEEGLSEVEERAIHELGLGAGARKVIVWVGHPLSDAEVLNKLSQ